MPTPREWRPCLRSAMLRSPMYLGVQEASAAGFLVVLSEVLRPGLHVWGSNATSGVRIQGGL
eukprot:350073-Chlamydomonas_euryale.AAC.10